MIRSIVTFALVSGLVSGLGCTGEPELHAPSPKGSTGLSKTDVQAIYLFVPETISQEVLAGTPDAGKDAKSSADVKDAK